jgi:tol-pal system protein YbgF
MKKPSIAAVLSVPLLVAALLAFALLASGCSGNPLRRDDPRDQEIEELRARVVDLQRKATVNEVEVARLRQQVAELETARPGGVRAAAPAPPVSPPPMSPMPPVSAVPKSPAPAPRPVTSTASRPAAGAPRLSAPASGAAGGIEEADIDMPAPAAKPARPAPSASAAPSRPASGQQSVKISAAEPLRPNPAPTVPKAPAAAPGGTGAESGAATQALYDRGYTLFHQGRYVDAEASFQRYLQANPTNELADNAEYWIGECRYSRGDLRGALAAFRETVERYPDGNKVPDALLKAGQSLEGMGDVEGARVTYKEVIRRFAGSAAAAVAEERQAKLPR